MEKDKISFKDRFLKYLFISLFLISIIAVILLIYERPSYDSICKEYKSPDFYSVSLNKTTASFPEFSAVTKSMFCINQANETYLQGFRIKYSAMGYLKTLFMDRIIFMIWMIVLAYLIAKCMEIGSRLKILERFDPIMRIIHYTSIKTYEMGSIFICVLILILIIGGWN